MSALEIGTARLEDISEMRLGLAYSASEAGTIPMIRAGDLGRPIRWPDILRAQLNASDVEGFLLQDGDVLLARSGVGSVGNVQEAINPPTAVFASYVIRIRPLGDWHGGYICYYLKSPTGQRALRSRAQGATNLNLSTSRIADIEIPEVSFPHQNQLALDLRAAEASYWSAQEKLTQTKAAIDELRRRLYISAIDAAGLRDDSESWDVTDLASITDNLDRERIPLNDGMRRQRVGEIPYYGASGIIDHVDAATHEGTFVLVSEDGSNLLSRKSDVAFVASGKFWANNHVHVLRPRSEVLPEFLVLQINNLDLTNLLTGTAQPKLPQGALNRLTIRVPSQDVQRAVLMAARELNSTYIQLLDSHREVTAHLNNAWVQMLEDAFHHPATQVQPLSIQEVSAWLDDVAPTLRSALKDSPPEASMSPAGNAARASASSVTAPSGWLTARQLFNIRYQSVISDELEEKIDDFYAWLKFSLNSGEVELRREGEETYLRISS